MHVMSSLRSQDDTAAALGTRPVLLLGRRGMLGRAWLQLLERVGLPFEAPRRDELDITDGRDVERAVLDRHGVVINCAAYADVDGAEAEAGLATQVNGHAVGALADRCERTGSLLVHYSTDYVFSGSHRTPYSIDHPPRPINAYGQSKALGEELIRASGCRHLIVRTSWLYAPWGRNFVRTLAQRLQRGEQIKVVHDQQGRPTSCEHLARCTFELVHRGVIGTSHIADGGQCTWYEFACETARLIDAGGRVEPCTTADYPRPARRPAYSVLDLSRTEDVLGPMPHWKENLADVVCRLQ
jgi:dTDP-4-dehydrorhamnose reductase